MYDWATWTWSMIHSTDPLVRALVFQFSAGLAVIDVPVPHNLIHLALKYLFFYTPTKKKIILLFLYS